MTGYPNKTNMLFAMPMTGRPIPPDVMMAFHAMAMPMNFNHYMLQIRGKEVGEARCDFAEHAIANKCKYIFFWDEDVACPPQSVPELVYRMEHDPEIAVCGGIYCLKRRPAEPLVFRGNGNGPYWDWKAGEFFEVTGIGMGCTMVRTEVFKDLKKPWFKTELNYSLMMDGIGGLETWTEDLWFCKRVTDTGKWKIYADASLLCTHYDMTTCEPFNLPVDSKPVQHMNTNGGKKILDVGSLVPYQPKEGTPITAGLTGTPNYRCDPRKLPFDNGEFDIVFSPVLDHYDSAETEEVLTEWVRVMRDTGELRLVVSDVKWIADQVATGKMEPSALYAERRKTAFTLESLQDALKVHGLTAKKVKSDMAHIAVRGIKNGVGG